MADQFLYGQAGTLYFPVYAAGGTRFATSGNWTPGGTCALISKDGGALAFPAGTVTLVGSKIWSLPLTAAELTAKRITIQITEPGTIDDQMLAVDTIQNDSAHWPAVLGSLGTVDLAKFLNGGTVNLGLYETKIRPAYNVNDDKLVAAGWVEKDGAVQNATSATFNLYTYDGQLIYGSSAWSTGPTEVAALNTWYVEKNTATLIKGGTTYVMLAEFNIGGVSYSRIEAFGAYGTGTGA